MATHLDKVPINQQSKLKARYQEKIRDLYDRSGFPTIKDIIEVSAVTKEGKTTVSFSSSKLFMISCCTKGISRLQEAILDAAVQATDPHTKEKVIGMMVS